MDIAAIRALTLRVNANVYGVAATVTPPGGATIVVDGIWLPPLDEDAPGGRNFQRREPRRVMAFRVSQVGESLPPGTIVVAAEYGGSTRSWKVELNAEPQNAEQVRVILAPA